MKTIIDAVNELQGDLSNVNYKGDETYHCNVNYNEDSGWWCSRGVYGDFVCTIDDFRFKALDMAHHSPQNSFDYMMANKEPLTKELDVDIDWSKYEIDYLMKNKSEPIYTQEMCDNGELPSVGMECLYYDDNKKQIKCKVMYLSEWVLVLSQTEKGYAQGVEIAKRVGDATVKPLTPPKTDKEKAINDTYRSDLSVKENLAIAYDQWSNK
jgi:hypothetical protein